MSATTLPCPVATTDHPHQNPKIDTNTAVEAVLQQYEGLKLADREEIDKSFVWPEGTRPDLVYDKYDPQVPVIDLSSVLKLEKLLSEGQARSQTGSGTEEEIRTCEEAKLGVERAIRAACEKYGFFQIINHGFPMEGVEQFTEGCRKLFDLPLEEKLNVEQELVPNGRTKAGYTAMNRSNGFTRSLKAQIWNEGFDIESPETSYPGRLEQLTSTLWPRESENSRQGPLLRSSAEEYGKHASSLTFRLLNLMATSLGIPGEFVESLLDYRQHNYVPAYIRVNHYPVCAQPELTWGLHCHTDPSLITLLHQDVGGLQIRIKDGTWHGVQPIPGAFVVNVGDFSQAWTNGRFLSAEHRVVANEKSERFSIAYFVLGQANCVFSPRPELVDDENPLRYRPFTMPEYFAALKAPGLGREKGQLLERALGIQTSEVMT